MYKTSGKIAQRRPRRFRLLGSGHGDDGVSPEPPPKHGRAVGTSSASSAPVLSLAGSTKYSSSRALSPRTASGSATSFVHQDMDSSSSIEPMTSSPSVLEHFSNVMAPSCAKRDRTSKLKSAIWRRYRDVVARLLKPNRDSNVITGNGSIIAPSGRQSRGKVEYRYLYRYHTEPVRDVLCHWVACMLR